MRIPNWYRVEKDGVKYFQAWNLHASGLVKHGFSSRVGGVSSEPYDTFNLGMSVADNVDNVVSNRRAFAAVLGVSMESVVVPNQVHGTNVRLVTIADAGSGAYAHDTAIPDTDALITNEPGITLVLHFADCVSIFFLDPENKAIGLAHAGWKGTVGKIVVATIEAMKKEFGTAPKHLQCAIGPSIGRHCYVVGEDVANEFYAAFPHNERALIPASPGKWLADLKSANLALLSGCGVDNRNTSVAQYCTCCNKYDYFSYRRDGETGRMAAWMCLA